MPSTNTPLTGINKSLSLHNQKLDEVIALFINYDPTAVRSIKELADKFSELYTQLFSEVVKVTDKMTADLDSATVAGTAGNEAMAAKFAASALIYIGYLIVDAIKLIGLVAKIVAKYIAIIALISLRIVETITMGVGLGIKDGINAATKYLSSLTGVLTDLISLIKTKATNAAKKAAKETMINGWTKDRDSLTASITPPNIVTPLVKEDTLKKIDLLNRNIAQANADL